MTAPFPSALGAGAIVLRRRQLSDIAGLHAAIDASIRELRRFLDWASNGTPMFDELRREIVARDAAFEAGTGFEYLLFEVATGELVGQAGAGLRDDDATALEVGYWTRTDRAGRGYATAAARAVTTMALDALPAIERVEIRMDKGNERSRRVAERLGFELVGEETFPGERLEGQTGEGYIWTVTRSTWP